MTNRGPKVGPLVLISPGSYSSSRFGTGPCYTSAPRRSERFILLKHAPLLRPLVIGRPTALRLPGGLVAVSACISVRVESLIICSVGFIIIVRVRWISVRGILSVSSSRAFIHAVTVAVGISIGHGR
jgi:hypothetical protein